MTADQFGRPWQRTLAMKAAPFIILVLAGLAARTSLAAAYPLIALLLFWWIASDTMMLSLLARSSGKPGAKAVLGVLAMASFTVLAGAPHALRDMALATPAILAVMGTFLVGHIAWGLIRAGISLRAHQDRKAGWIAAASEVLPPALVRLAAAELAILHMALFRWGGPADVPADCRAFSYHRHLAPMCAVMLVLSAIEMTVYHLLLGHWSRTAAMILFVISDAGFVYLVGFIKSFRFRPVLLTLEGVRVRTGFLIDQLIPFESIARIETGFSGTQVRAPGSFNAALLAWPNILLVLDPPVQRPSLFKGSRAYSKIAFRLDDPEAFVRLLRWRLGRIAP